jgi:beta-galactosidase/beta-glucuronidase
MPAQVHDVLLAHGRIPDPRVGKQAAESAWVGERDWAYGRVFASPAGDGPVFLRFAGLDTLATVIVNGAEVGSFANMHRHYAVEIRDVLNPPGETNTLLVIFASPLRYVAAASEDKAIPAFHYLRKCRSDFNAYLGARPHSVKVGIFDDVVVDVPDGAWLEDVHVRPELSPDLFHADVGVTVAWAGRPADLRWVLSDPDGRTVAEGAVALADDGAEASFAVLVADPALWWPRTHGAPALYRLEVGLDVEGRTVDRRQVGVGIRRIRPVLEDVATGEPRFAFEVNGSMIFLRGACWAPLQGMTHRWDEERAERLLDLVEHGRMNVLRVWGGGLIPPASFYEACDRRGILIWQDFMFGYGMYPDHKPGFVANCRAEIEDVVRRLRSHPSIALWCGGNENHMGWDFAHGTEPAMGRDLFESVIPGVCADLDPDRLYHPSSPYGGAAPNWPLEGDWHDYTTLTFSPHASVPLYASEIGRASAPSITSMRKFMSEEALWPEGHDARIRTPDEAAWPPMWQYRSVNGSWDKVGPTEDFCDPTSPEDLVRVLGTAHGEYLQRRVERHRRGVPDGAPDGGRRCWGTTIWRLNDPWPILYWSVVDAYLEPKIPYYFLRRAYAPVLVSFERTPDTIAVWVVNDSAEPVAGTLRVVRARFDGEVLQTLAGDVRVRPGGSQRCLDLTPFGPVNLRSEYLAATLEAGDRTVTARFLLAGERHLHLPKATLDVRRTDAGVEIHTDVFARQVTLTMVDRTGAVFADNCFDMVPGETRRIEVLRDAGGRALRVEALNGEGQEVEGPPPL